MNILLIICLLTSGVAGVQESSERIIKISSKRAVQNIDTNITTLIDKVVVVDGEMTIRCDKMTIESEKVQITGENEKSKTEAKFVVAEKNVSITKKDSIAYGDRAEYFVLEKKVVLTGNPKIIQTDPKTGKKNEIRGSVITLYRDKNIVEISDMNGDLTKEEKTAK